MFIVLPLFFSLREVLLQNSVYWITWAIRQKKTEWIEAQPEGKIFMQFWRVVTASEVLDCGERRAGRPLASLRSSSRFQSNTVSLKPPWPWGSQASAAATSPLAARSLPWVPASLAGPSRGPRLSATLPSKPKVILFIHRCSFTSPFLPRLVEEKRMPSDWHLECLRALAY
jgi:hypothetical protein